MPTKRRAQAYWIEKEERWKINVQSEGQRPSFYSTIKGKRGKHDAEAQADEWLEEMHTGDMRFGKAWEQFLEYVKSRNRNGSSGNYVNHESRGRIWLLPKFGNRMMSTIREEEFEALLKEAAKQGKSKRTCVNIRESINAFYKWGKKKKRLNIDRPEEIEIPSNAAEPIEKEILQPEMLRILFSRDYTLFRGKKVPCFMIHAFRFTVAQGPRRGEVCGLKRTELTASAVPIKRSVNRLLEETRGKTKKARRNLARSSYTNKILDDQMAMLKRRGIISPWLFPDEHGERLNPDHFTNAWNSYKRAHGITCTLQELRRTWVSMMKNAMPEQMLKRQVGHTDEMDTYGVYADEVDGELEEAGEIMDVVINRILNPSK